MTGKNSGKTYGDALDAGPRVRKDDCSIDRVIPLQRVDPTQASGLKVGRKLMISMVQKSGVKSVVCLHPDTFKYLGSVAFAGVDKLIACMEKGHDYEAEIKKISGAAIHVKLYDR